MKRVAVLEHEKLHRGGNTGERGGKVYLSRKHFRRLRRFDERLSPSAGKQIFSWRTRYAKVKQYVGVVQVPGLTVEVLPKIEDRDVKKTTDGQDGRVAFARKNLLYMLMLAGELPIRERDVASQSAEVAPLVETLIAIFARRLREELLIGRDRDYVKRRGNLSTVKGKLLFGEHIKQNAAHKERFFVEYEEFLPDTTLNRVFKAACRVLVEVTNSHETQETLGHCLMLLDRVSDVRVDESDFDSVFLNRQNDRFAEVFEFCRLILTGRAPSGTFGNQRSFSLLFDMNVLFESFMTEFIRRYVLRHTAFGNPTVFAQGKKKTRYLVYRPGDDDQEGVGDYEPADGEGHLRLKPDILIEADADAEDRSSPLIVIDTKWKRLKESRSARQGVSRTDLYQMFGYAHSYRALDNVLLYPKPPDDVEPEEFDIPQPIQRDVGGKTRYGSIQVKFVNLDRDLKRDRAGLVEELRRKLAPMFGLSPRLVADTRSPSGSRQEGEAE